MTKTQAPLVASLVMTMQLPHIVKPGLMLHIKHCQELSLSTGHSHDILKTTAPQFYDHYMSHVKTLSN